MRRSIWTIACLLLPLAGCAGPTHTIAELGMPVFADAVGADTRFERPDPEQRRALDAFPPDTVETDADHSFAISFWPISSEELVALEVRARPKGNLPLTKLVAAAYAVSQDEAMAYGMDGSLPRPDQPLASGGELQEDEEGNLVLALIFPRDAIPAGTERLAMPVLAQFRDGWIHVRYYQTVIPDPLRTLTEEEIRLQQQLEAHEAGQQNGTEASPAEDPVDPAGDTGQAGE